MTFSTFWIFLIIKCVFSGKGKFLVLKSFVCESFVRFWIWPISTMLVDICWIYTEGHHGFFKNFLGFICFNSRILTLFQLGGGVKSSRTTLNPSAISKGLGLGSPKLLTLFLSIPDRSQRSHFWNFFLKVAENWTSKIFRSPRAFGEKLKNRKKN